MSIPKLQCSLCAGVVIMGAPLQWPWGFPKAALQPKGLVSIAPGSAGVISYFSSAKIRFTSYCVTRGL